MPPPILLCVSVVTCAAVWGGARCLSNCWLFWPCLTASHTNALHLYLYLIHRKAFCFYFVALCVQQQDEQSDVPQRYSQLFFKKKKKRKEDLGVETVTFRVYLYSKLPQQSYDDDLQSCWPMLCELRVNYGVKNHCLTFLWTFTNYFFKICAPWVWMSATNCKWVIFHER